MPVSDQQHTSCLIVKLVNKFNLMMRIDKSNILIYDITDCLVEMKCLLSVETMWLKTYR